MGFGWKDTIYELINTREQCVKKYSWWWLWVVKSCKGESNETWWEKLMNYNVKRNKNTLWMSMSRWSIIYIK